MIIEYLTDHPAAKSAEIAEYAGLSADGTFMGKKRIFLAGTGRLDAADRKEVSFLHFSGKTCAFAD